MPSPTLAELGATAFINGRSAERLDGAIAPLKGEVAGGWFESAATDVATREGTEAVVARLPAVDILVTTPASSSQSRSSRFQTRIGSASST